MGLTRQMMDDRSCVQADTSAKYLDRCLPFGPHPSPLCQPAIPPGSELKGDAVEGPCATNVNRAGDVGPKSSSGYRAAGDIDSGANKT